MKHVLQPKSPLLSPFTLTITHCECKLKGRLTPSESEHFYRPQRSWGKVMFLHVSVILFTGGVCPIACWDIHPPIRGRHPSQTRHPLGPGTPPAQCMLGDTGNKRAVCILLECNLVFDVSL